MADLISTLTTDIQVRFADLVTATAERYFNQIHNMVLMELGIRDTTADISLVSGTRAYTLPEADIQIKEAYLIRSSSANDHIRLLKTTEDWMDLHDLNWRNRTSQGGPTRFWVSSAASSNNTLKKVLFDPIPPTTTSGGYPIVRLYVVQNVTLTSTDTVPVELSSSQVYLDGASWLHAKATRRDLKEIENLFQEFRKSMDYEKFYHKNLVRNVPDAVNLSGFVRGASVV